MSIEIRVPTPLRGFTGGKEKIPANGQTVGEVLGDLTRQYPGIQKHLFSEDGKLRSFVTVYLNEEDVRYLDRQQTAVKSGDVVTIIPSIAGGRPGALAFPSMNKLSGAGGQGRAAPPTKLTQDQMYRYSRHLILPDVGMAGQLKLLGAKVLIVGTGGLGSPLALYLAAAGVGTLGLVDFDVVEASNLQRQIIFGKSDVGKPKLYGAEQRIRGLNPDVEIIKHEGRLTSQNALEIIKDYDVVVDGTDNFPTRYLVNDACVLLKKPNVYGSIYRFDGQVSVFDATQGPCYRCLYQEPPPPGLVPSCAEGGVLGVLPGIVGTLQALETIKLILGKGESMVGRLLLVDALTLRFRELKVRKNPDCVICGPNATQKELIDYEQFCGISGHTDQTGSDIMVEELKARIDKGEAPVLVDVREPQEYELVHLPDSKLIPLAALPERLGELSTADDIVVYCKSGGRSAFATIFLQDMGFKRVHNLAGGIDAWARKVDPSLPRY
jgi:adenylyltransferase/sulfurtransferase